MRVADELCPIVYLLVCLIAFLWTIQTGSVVPGDTFLNRMEAVLERLHKV